MTSDREKLRQLADADIRKRNAGEPCLTIWRNGNYVYHGERDAEEATLCEPDDVLVSIRLRDMKALTFITPQQRIGLAENLFGSRAATDGRAEIGSDDPLAKSLRATVDVPSPSPIDVSGIMVGSPAATPEVEREDLEKLENWLTEGTFYEDYDESLRLLGVFRKCLQSLSARDVIKNDADKLRRALKPFAEIRADDGNTIQTYPRDVVLRCEVTAGNIQDARAALAEGGAA